MSIPDLPTNNFNTTPLFHSSTIKCLDALSVGSYYLNGSYDGLIGSVQRNETNSFIGLVPYDSLFNEPAIFIPAPTPAFTPHIYSVKIQGGHKTDLDILYLYTNFEIKTWIYWLIAFCITSTILVSMDLLLIREHREQAKKVFSRFCYTWWYYFMLTMDIAPTRVSTFLSPTVLWIAIVVAVFYGIHMIFMGTLSSDLTVSEPDKWVSTLKDLLYEDQFKNFTPTVFSQMNMLNALSTARDGTEESVLYRRVVANENVSVVTFQQADPMGQMMKITIELTDGKRAVIEDSSFLDMFLRHFTCNLIPERAENIIKSNEIILGAPLAMILSHSTHPEVVKLFEYRTRTGMETGFEKGTMTRKVGWAIAESGMTTRSSKGLQCSDILERVIMQSFGEKWDPIPIQFFGRFISICSSIISTALIVLLGELFLFKVKGMLKNY